MSKSKTIEELRLAKQAGAGLPTAKWGPYVSEREWGTVREDYSWNGDAWNYISHDTARSRAYRWGEDGIAGISDANGQLCFAPTFWNGHDSILKERLFGLSNTEGNHGEDVKELYYYLDNTPTHSYMQYLYKYPQEPFPYERLIEENRKRSLTETEYEILDTGVFDKGNYFDITITYAKINDEDICIRIEAVNRGQEEAPLAVLPTLWFRKQWSPNLIKGPKPEITLMENKQRNLVRASHHYLGQYFMYFDHPDQLLFTENETNRERIFGEPNESPFVKDAFHHTVTSNDFAIFENKKSGTKFAPLFRTTIKGGEKKEFCLRLSRHKNLADPLGADFQSAFLKAKREANGFYKNVLPKNMHPDEARIARQAYAGMLWNKQFYYFDVREWLKGDKDLPPPPSERETGRNSYWKHLNNRDIISVPDKWEFPWYASWDLAFHMVVFAYIDPEFAKQQQILLNREWFTHPNGQLPAYEWNFGDVNPPVQAWAAMQVYEIDKEKTGKGDIKFLKRIFQKLNINFTWWANQKDKNHNHIFEGGFLGLDNIGVLNRSHIGEGYSLEQADGTAWMGMFATSMLQMAIEITQHDDTFQDVALKYFEQYNLIAESLNTNHLWDESESFFFDVLKKPNGKEALLQVRSIVGLTSIFAALHIPAEILLKVYKLKHGIDWYDHYSREKNLYQSVVFKNGDEKSDMLISLVHIEKLKKLLYALLDENEFLSPFGIRSVSKMHSKTYEVEIGGQLFSLHYDPGESTTKMFGGNSNWRGPIWFPMNFMIIRSLKIYHNFYGDDLKVEFPSRSGNYLNLGQVGDEISKRLQNIFIKDDHSERAVFGAYNDFYNRPENDKLVLFHEYFHGETGMGLGASHQTGWTGLIAALLQDSKIKEPEKREHQADKTTTNNL